MHIETDRPCKNRLKKQPRPESNGKGNSPGKATGFVQWNANNLYERLSFGKMQ